jgi:hypothetical protein
MNNIPPPLNYATTDGGARPTSPWAVPQSSVAKEESTAFGMPHIDGFTENKIPGGDAALQADDQPIGAPTPFRRGHRRNSSTVLSIKDLVPRGDPQKGVEHNAESVRAVGNQFVPQPSTPQPEEPPIFGYTPDHALTQGIFASPNFKHGKFRAEDLDGKNDSKPSTLTRSTNLIDHTGVNEALEMSSSPSLPNSPPLLTESPSSSKEDLIIFPPGMYASTLVTRLSHRAPPLRLSRGIGVIQGRALLLAMLPSRYQSRPRNSKTTSTRRRCCHSVMATQTPRQQTRTQVAISRPEK